MLKDISEIILPINMTDYAENIYWVYGIVLKIEVPVEVDGLMQELRKVGIGSRAFFWCMHEQPVFIKSGLFYGEKYPNAERLARRGLYIPSGVTLTFAQQEYVAHHLKEILSLHYQ